MKEDMLELKMMDEEEESWRVYMEGLKVQVNSHKFLISSRSHKLKHHDKKKVIVFIFYFFAIFNSNV